MASHPGIAVIPMGDVPPAILTGLQAGLEENFALPVIIRPNQGLPVFAFDPGRQQYNAHLIIQELPKLGPGNAIKFLAITSGDLFSPIFSFVFGEAQLGGASAVLSTFRLNPAAAKITAFGCPSLGDRVEKEAVHELGHTFGLRHCLDPDCVMHYSAELACADRKFSFFCRPCRILLEQALPQDEKIRVATEQARPARSRIIGRHP